MDARESDFLRVRASAEQNAANEAREIARRIAVERDYELILDLIPPMRSLFEQAQWHREQKRAVDGA